MRPYALRMGMRLCYREPMGEFHMPRLSESKRVPQSNATTLGHVCFAPFGMSRAFVLLSGAGGLLRLRRAR